MIHGNYTRVDCTKIDYFTHRPTTCDDDSPEEPGNIGLVEIRVHFSTFMSSSLDYDPEISVLFDSSSGGSGACSTDDYEVYTDVIFWLSVGSVMTVLYCVILVILFSYTGRGKKIIRGTHDQRRGSVIITDSDFTRESVQGFHRSSAPVDNFSCL